MEKLTRTCNSLLGLHTHTKIDGNIVRGMTWEVVTFRTQE